MRGYQRFQRAIRSRDLSGSDGINARTALIGKFYTAQIVKICGFFDADL
ncbi:hypothetical protein SAMN04490178_12366 [Propionispora vibrioides]|uniref:Uncharacterized protein n=1 Tax=Propionispora vibrioides TaxID=112903 RepID=A0A1H8XGB4_9FIRM|nr:hypothetical protein SAMN04490178_12366 [Propionispora vibrioides]